MHESNRTDDGICRLMVERGLEAIGVLTLAVILFGFPVTAKAQRIYLPYNGEGPFVEVPAKVGFFVVGAPFALAGSLLWCLPVSLITGEYGKFWKDNLYCAFFFGLMPGMAGGYIVGFPFYFVKMVFWDWPRKIIGIEEEVPDGSVGETKYYRRFDGFGITLESQINLPR